MKSTRLQSLIYKNYLKSSLIPIFVIEMALLLLYFGINAYISGQNRATLLNEATKNTQEIASREVATINRQLQAVSDLARIMAKDHEAFFAAPDACYLPNGTPQFSVHSNGAYFKTVDNGGGSLYYSSTTHIGDAEKRKARCSEMLDPLLKSIVDTSPIITQAYLNTWDDLNRLYPFMKDAPSQYGPAINMEDFNFYYDADLAHNPTRQPVWTGAYLDPAGQGWMVSLIVPIYHGDFLEGVSGLDVTIASFVQNILDLQFPWDAATFMVDKSGTILAMQPRAEEILKLKELGDHTYENNIKETIEKPDEFNLLHSPHPELRDQFGSIFASKAHIASMQIDATDYLVSQEIVRQTGWRMITFIEKKKVFTPITNLKAVSDRVGMAAILVMVVFYTLFFFYLISKSHRLSNAIAAPIIRLTELTHDLGKQLKSEPLGFSGISEVDTLTENFNTMTRELNLAMGEAMAAREEADSVISNFLDSLLVVDSRQRITRVNRETCHLLGFNEEEILGKPVSLLFDEPESVVEALFLFPFRPDTQEKNELRNIELTFVAKDGSKLPVSINLARVSHEDGETVGVVAGAKAIAELKNALRQAERQKEFIQNIIDTIPGGLLVLDGALQLTRSNDTYNRLLAYWSTTYGIDAHRLTTELQSGLSEQLPERPSGEISITGKTDELIVEFHASTGYARDSENSRVIYLHDVTSRHKAEAVRKLQSTVLEQTSEGVVITDTRGVILNCNLAAQTMSGYSSDELIGKSTSLFKSGMHEPDFYKCLWENLNKGVVWTNSITNKRRDGSFFEAEMTVSPVRSTGNDVTHFVALWRDVTQERFLQQQLLHAQKLEAIGQLAAGVAHEINTPIQYIMSNLSFFGETFEDIVPILNELQRGLEHRELFSDAQWHEELARLVDDAGLEDIIEEVPEAISDGLAGVKHVARIVEALKEFSHPGGNQQNLTDLNRLIDNALTVAQNELKYVAEIETSFDLQLPQLLCDPGAISQVMLNLLINAADAIRERNEAGVQGHIKVATRTVDSMIEIRVSDDGAGIPDDIRDRIFDPFFTTKAVGKGSGQGLAIGYDIVVNKHHGSIRCESVPGSGTAMILRFPQQSTEE